MTAESAEMKRIRKLLRPGELPRYLIGAHSAAGYGALSLTSERVLFVRGRLFSQAVDEFPLDRIDSVSFQTGLVRGSITLMLSGGRTAKFDLIAKSDLNFMSDAIRGAVDVVRKSGSSDVAELLRRLKALKDDGVLTDEEWERAKVRYLGHAPDQREAMLRTLAGLSDLRKAGVLSTVEFEIKKRDFLATTH